MATRLGSKLVALISACTLCPVPGLHTYYQKNRHKKQKIYVNVGMKKAQKQEIIQDARFGVFLHSTSKYMYLHATV